MKYTTESVIALIHEKFGDKYDCSQVNYRTQKIPLQLICKEHGPFEKRLPSLLRGVGCPVCYELRKKEDYARRAEKRRETVREKYGVDNVMQLQEVREKRDEAFMRQHGVSNPRQLQSVIDKARQTNLDRYGAISYAKSEVGLHQIQKTMMERYGVDNFMKSDAYLAVAAEMKEKSRQTQLQRYGVEHYAQSLDAKLHLAERKEKEYQSKREHHSWHISEPEKVMQMMLEDYFGQEDVKTQYSSDVYPFLCDFYIVSRDLYIEMNVMWTHGGHWFRSDLDCDQMELKKWKQKHMKFYDNGVVNWTQSDVKKRMCAANHHLNYLTFWMENMWDVDLWFACDCPDAMDWDHEYSWLPNRMLDEHCVSYKLLPSARQMSLIAKHYQCSVFYEHEFHLWEENSFYKGIPLQAYLYINRYHYLKKRPGELSDFELLRSFVYSGVYRGYTVFDASLMLQFLDSHSDITGIYDPFAGWGERMLCAASRQIPYVGVDVNDKLASGYERMIKDLSLSDVSFSVGNCLQFPMPVGLNTVITCPPYWSTEHYSDTGMENTDKEQFVSLFGQVVDRCLSVKYFCIQVNQMTKNLLKPVLELKGFHLVDAFRFLSQKVSHLNRKNGVVSKKEFEEFLIFKR